MLELLDKWGGYQNIKSIRKHENIENIYVELNIKSIEDTFSIVLQSDIVGYLESIGAELIVSVDRSVSA